MQRGRIPVDGDVTGRLHPQLVVARDRATVAEGKPGTVFAAAKSRQIDASQTERVAEAEAVVAVG